MNYPNREAQLAHIVRPDNPDLDAYRVAEGGIVRLFETSDQAIKMPSKWFFGRSIAVLGISGSGKTQTLKRLIAELYESTGVNMTIFDPEGDYPVMRSMFPEWNIVGEFEPLNPNDAERICERAIKNGHPTIISLVETQRSKWVEFVLRYLTKEWDMSNHYRNRDQINMPHLNLLEEADTFIPRSLQAISSFKEKQQFVELKDVVGKYSKQGRKRGISIILATQRIPAIDTTAISQVNTIFFHRVGFDVDVDRFAKLMGIKPSEMKPVVDKLKVGECIVSGDFNRGDGQIHKYKVRILPVKDVSKTATPEDVKYFNNLMKRGELNETPSR